MIRLSAFADEISSDPIEQVAVLRGEGIQHLELRSAWNVNVLDLSDYQVEHLKEIFDRDDITVSAIGSPIGKVPIDCVWEDHLRRFERAIVVAHMFGTAFIRVFSFYPPHGVDGPPLPHTYRDEVLTRLRTMTERARAAGITLLHENEKDIYGDSLVRCIDLMTALDDPHVRSAMDAANFIQCGETPYPDAYEALRPWIRYIHVKDAQPDGTVVAAGRGATRWPDLLSRLRDDGYDGFLSLEPHLGSAGQYRGFSGPDLFHEASLSLQRLLRDMGWKWQ